MSIYVPPKVLNALVRPVARWTHSAGATDVQ